MSRSIVRHLILKDLYLVRWMIAGSIASGGVALALLPLSSVSAYVGGVSLICVLITLNIFLVMTGVAQERKDKVLLFVLSLPVSTTQYLVAKVVAYAIAFVVPWLALTAATVGLIYGSQIPDGILPFWVAVLVYLLFYFCALLAVAVVSDSTGWHTTAIIVGNVSVNFLIPFLLRRPSVVAHANGPTAVWTADILAILAIELAAGAAALGFAVYFRSRNPDFV
jgi:ABC-type transport system involved in multi-copper enzyme maturation permease subunit